MTINHCDGLPRDGLSRHSFWATAEVLRGLDRCSSLLGMIDFQPFLSTIAPVLSSFCEGGSATVEAFSLQHCLFGALAPAEIKIVEGAAK